MIAVLGVCTLVAAALSQRPGQPDRELMVGSFRVPQPEDFVPQSRSEQAVKLLEQQGPGGRVMQVAVLADRGLRTPLTARLAAEEMLAPAANWVDGRSFYRGPLTVSAWVGVTQGQTPGGRRAVQKNLLAVATEDGRAYLAIHVSGFGRPREADYRVVEAMVDRIDDVRWTEHGAGSIDLAGRALKAPGEASRWLVEDRGSGKPRYALFPVDRPVFYRIHTSTDRLDGIAADDPTTPGEQTLTRLRRYAELAFASRHGGPPRSERVGQGKINGVPTAGVVQAVGRDREPTLETWAAAMPDGRGVLRLDTLAVGEQMAAARTLTHRIIAGLAGGDAPDEEPEVDVDAQLKPEPQTEPAPGGGRP